jgi:hypothetical protein
MKLSTTPALLVRKSATLQMLSSMVLIASCYRERLPKEHIPFNLVSILTEDMIPSNGTSVLMMAETCLLAESAICYPPLYDDLRAVQVRPTETSETVAIAAVAAAAEQDAKALLVLSTSGQTAALVSKYRPKIPIITGRFSGFCFAQRHNMKHLEHSDP